MQDQNAKEKALQSISTMSSAQIVSATAIHSKLLPGIVRTSFPGSAQVTHTRATQTSNKSRKHKDMKPFFFFFCTTWWPHMLSLKSWHTHNITHRSSVLTHVCVCVCLCFSSAVAGDDSRRTVQLYCRGVSHTLLTHSYVMSLLIFCFDLCGCFDLYCLI